jgi:sugar lactone lactonase YvrE
MRTRAQSNRTATLVYAGRAELAEGPVWHDGALWWVDIVAGTLNRLNPATGHNTSRATGEFLGCAAPATDGRWMIGRQRECALLDFRTGAIEPLPISLPGMHPRNRLNDGKCDPAGRFWVGSMNLDRKNGFASLYAITHRAASATQVRSGLSLANGLAWTPRGDTFFHIDTPTRRIERFDYDIATGLLSSERVLFEFAEADGWPDGMTCDSAGNLWVGLWAGKHVVYVDGQTGELLEKIPIPASNVSSCTLGGEDLRTLFVTTAWEGFDFAQRQAEPHAGNIFSMLVETPGIPVSLYRL